MIFLSAVPDDTYFIWQSLTLYENLKQLDVDINDIYLLVGYDKHKGINTEWDKYKDVIHANVIFIEDTRQSKQYLVSIKPHLYKKFFRENDDFLTEYIFYHDVDILFSEIPLFEGMEDGRIHASDVSSYIGYDYIKSKKSRLLIIDLINVVGIDEETIKINQSNTGGAQFYAKGLGYQYWDKVENECELMWIKYHQNIKYYIDEFEANGGQNFNFQIWTAEMWVMLWNQWLFGHVVYVNPDLHFNWPDTPVSEWYNRFIFHNSGTIKKLHTENESEEKKNEINNFNNNWFFKDDYRNKYPNELKHCLLNNGSESCQSEYVRAVTNTSRLYWNQPFVHHHTVVQDYSVTVNYPEIVVVNEPILTEFQTIEKQVEIDPYDLYSFVFIFEEGDNFDSFITKYNNFSYYKELLIINKMNLNINTVDSTIRIINNKEGDYNYALKFIFGFPINLKHV